MRQIILAALALIPTSVLAANLAKPQINWEINVNGTAADVNGAGFDWGATATFLADLTCSSATSAHPICSSASYTFVAADNNAWLFVKSGTNWTPGWYKIIDECVASAWSQSIGVGACTTGQFIPDGTIGNAVQQNTTVGQPSPFYNANTAAGVATNASVSTGTFGVDYSQTTASITNNTDGGFTNASPSVATSVGSPFTAAMPGDIVHINTTGTGAHCVVGWYEVVSMSGANATLDRNATDGVANGVACTFHVGGAMSLGSSSLDSSFFAQGSATNLTGGNRFFVKNGTLTLSQSVGSNGNGGTQSPIVVEGYNALRGDAPTGTNRPTISVGATTITWGSNWGMYNIITTGSGTNPMVSSGNATRIVNCKFTNQSTGAALTLSGNAVAINSEVVAYKGNAVQMSAGSMLISSYVHSSDVLVLDQANNAALINDILENPTTAGIKNLSNAANSETVIRNCTIYGSEDKSPTNGVWWAVTAATIPVVSNNIIYGWATGVNHIDSGETNGYDEYNDYNNNTTDATNWVKGTSSITTAPSFVNETQTTGTNASSLAGNKMQDSTKNFVTAGVTAGTDFLNVTAATGLTSGTGMYKITAITTTTNPNDTLTLDITFTNGATGIHYGITSGHNLAIGGGLKGKGFPGAFQAGLTTGYLDIGAAQTSSGQRSSGFAQ